MAIALSLIGIAVSIIIGWKWKFNTGVIAMVFAFLIGTLCSFPQVNKAGVAVVQPFTVNQIVSMFPTSIVFYLIAIALFFGYATETGTMDVLGKRLLHVLGGNSKLVPWVIALVSAVIGALGAGASTPIIVGPFAFTMAIEAGVSPLLCAIMIGVGSTAGTSNPFNGWGGVVGKNLMLANGLDEATAQTIALDCWYNTCIIVAILLVVWFFIEKGFKAKKDVKVMTEKPTYNAQQKKMLVIVLLAFFFMIVPPLLVAWWPKVPFFVTFNRVCQPQTVMVVGAVICAFMGLANERKIISKCPWNTIVMIIGVYMLIQVANKGGFADAIANTLATAVPAWLVPAAIIAFGGFLSFFSATTSVVMPLLYPIAPSLITAFGLNPVTVYSCCFYAGLTTGLSPFSAGGAILIASCPDEEVKETLPNKQIVAIGINYALTIILVMLGVFNFFHL